MKKALWILGFGMVTGLWVQAQETAVAWLYDPMGIELRKSVRRVDWPVDAIGLTLEECASVLSQTLDPKAEWAFVLTDVRQSPVAEHALYERYWKGLPVYRGEAKLNRDAQGWVFSWYALDVPHRLATDGTAMGSSPALPLPRAASYLDRKVWFPTQQGLVEARQRRFRDSASVHVEWIEDALGRVLFARDLNAYHAVQPNDTTLQLKVFNPDPLTTAGFTYGGDPQGLLIDNNDQDIGALNNQRQTKSVKGEYRNGSFQLRNSRIVLKDFENPVAPVVTRTSPIFDFTRSQSGFEDCNAYYHLTVYQDYMQSLGFNLCEDTVFVDPHGWNGQDQSSFSYFPNGGGNLSLGEGGVDDAEDADVIVHEYGHAISYSAAPNTNNGTERRCLDEALGDYLAASYSHSINPYGWDRVFSWDGHNIFWDGRMASSTKYYPNLNFGGNIYVHAELWAAAIMDIYFELGRSVADATLLQSLYAYSSNIGFPEAALEYLEADSLRTGGAHALAMYEVFHNRGILDIPNFNTPETGALEASVKLYGSLSFAGGGSVRVVSDRSLGSWSLVDLSGRTVASGQTRESELEVSSARLASGIYVLRLSTPQGPAVFRLIRR
ncbi:T9SS type A sorting domain-containing protein [bacterium]|nr:T9SS type A sorting domain-containing protein [bacterium]